MGWRSRVLLGRLRDQGTVVATVALVTFVATTLLGTFAFLLDVAGDDAVEAALAQAPRSAVAVEATVRVRYEDTQAALDAADATLTTVLGDLPAERSTWLHGRLWNLPRHGDVPQRPLAYPASSPLVPDQAELVTGTWPERARDEAGMLPVNVPDVAARRYGWAVGTRIPVDALGAPATDTWVVVGTHRLTGPPASWTRDRLDGGAHDPLFPVPGTLGRATAELWGPFVVAPEALLGPGVVETAHLVATPDLAGAPRGAVTAARDALETAQTHLTASLRTAGVSGFVRSDLDRTVDGAWSELAVTRVGVVIVGLLLVVLATTVMLLAARLLGERRSAEAELVAARGASPGQLRSLAALEAVLLAALATALAPWLARVAFTWLAAASGLDAAGLVAPAGVPASVRLACAAVAVVLAVALLLPAWHVDGSSTLAAHAGLVRGGADVGLAVLGGVALWQLLHHGAPIVRTSGDARLDPVLVVGPALVTLAAAVLALRLVGPVAAGADALARRSRSLVAPLAAWQVSRARATATGTTLVVVLAVTVATFSHAFLHTWRVSQQDQVDLATAADVRLDEVRGERLTVSADVRGALADAGPGVRVQPVADRPAQVGRALGFGQDGAPVDVHLVAVDTAHPEDLRGRGPAPWAGVVDGLDLPVDGPADPVGTGTALPGDPAWLLATVSPGAVPSAAGTAQLSLAFEDEADVRTWVRLPGVSLDSSTPVVVGLPRSLGTLRLVAVAATVTLVAPPASVSPMSTTRERLGHVAIALHDARVVDRAAGVTLPTEAAAAPGEGVDLGGVRWWGTSRSGGTVLAVTSGAEATTAGPVPADALVLDAELDMLALAETGGLVVAHSWATHGVARAVVTEELAEKAGVAPGGYFWLRVGGTQVEVQVARVVPWVPGQPRGAALLLDRTALGRTVVEAGGTDPLVDAFWATAPADRAADVAATAQAVTDGTATVRVAERARAVTGPLRVALPAGLSLVGAATLVLVVVGLGTSAAAAVRSRRLEMARLQALGADRRSLVAGLVGEHALLVVVGTLAGLGIGHGLARVVVPVLTVSPDGRPPVPDPVLVWQHGTVSALTLGLATAACLTVAALAAVQVRRATGALLRLGDDR